jgi:aspartate racemase
MSSIERQGMHRTRVVGILGGMGPAAGADFARLFVQACADHMRSLQIPVSDQAFPEHWLAQVPVPDRSTALGSPGPGGHQPLDPMLHAMGKLAALGATTVAVACNTAHAWHGQLQERFPQLEVLHVAREVARPWPRAACGKWACWPPRARTAPAFTTRRCARPGCNAIFLRGRT